MKKLWDWKKVVSNLELEGQGRGIIMGVTCLLLLGPFYTIRTKGDQTFWRGVYLLQIKLTHPVGPLRLSTHPFTGYFQDATTMDGRTMARGKLWPFSNISCSASPFVNTYVLGCSPLNKGEKVSFWMIDLLWFFNTSSKIVHYSRRQSVS